MFKPCSTPGSCEVNFKVTFEVSSFLHANAIQLFFDDVALTQLNAFIGRARKVYGTAPRSISQTAAKPERPPVPTASTVKSTSTSRKDSGVANTESTSDEDDESAKREAKARASRRIKGGISAQNYSDLAAVFSDYADKDGKLYYGGFTAACMALSDEYEDMKDISDSAALAGAVFSSFETHATPKDWLTLDEFVVGVYLMTKGTFEQKAHNLFEVVNKNGDGKITREELTHAMQRRIRAVKKLFPKLLSDQVKIQMANEQVEELSSVQDAAVASSVQAIEELMEEVEKEIPLAVNQIFREADLDQDDYIREQEWLFAWQAHPEFVELLTIDGMKKMAQWASVVQEANDDDDKTGSSGQSLDTRLTYAD
ncbi:Coenzyme Q-binding protein COQ10 [Phytophthora citrophthora]|uniref:Coenzyme Q-binding protein COQ10 n=1 Tax=Phytophthora citrophthora TaxID=4793 RepID=A0AAD9LRN2_9STRA|nr:Coenzyme Q-binding protein COQ10 [Phytophthora citrophthora]